MGDDGQDHHYEVDQHERLSFIEYRNENPELEFGSFIWDQYQHVHICTDLPMLLHVNSKTCAEEESLSLPNRALAVLLTQKHLIVSMEDGLIQWYRTEMPPINFKAAAESVQDKHIILTQDVDQEYKFEPAQLSANTDSTTEVPPEPIAFMHYTRNFKKIIMGTHQGLIGILGIEAEAINEDEEQEDDQHKNKETKVLDTPFVELGRFHTKKINGMRELGNST